MSARTEFNKKMQKMQESAKKSVPQNSTEALIKKMEEDASGGKKPAGKPKAAAEPVSKTATPEKPLVRQRTIKQPLGRPKKYEGEQEVITIKVPKEIKDKVRAAAAANRMSLVDYLMYIVENDYNEHYSEYES
ncbi:MAG: hypothetical protein K6F73_03070 [Lachnospiraceae bacterium]|nr:hypothetical protein [Lachnospiraceae bacterium]